MRMHTARPDLLVAWYLPVIVLNILIVIFFPHYLLYFSKFNSLLFFVALLLIVSPLGNVRLGDKEISSIDFVKKCGIIMLCEIVITVIYCGTQLALSNLSNETSIDNSYIYSLLVTHAWRNLTLYPWTLYAILTVIMLWTYFKLKFKPTTLGCGMKPLFGNQFTSDIIVSVDFFFRSAFVIFAITTISIGIITSIYGIAVLFHLPLVDGLNLKNFLIFIVIQQIIFSKKSNYIFSYLRTSGKSLGYCLIMLTVLIVILFFILNYITDILANYVVILRLTTNLPFWISNLSTENHYLLLFSWSWLFAIAAGIAYFFAKITEGWRVRTIIIVILMLPLMINIVSLIFPIGTEKIISSSLFKTYLMNSDFLPISSFTLLLLCFLYTPDINGLFRLSLSLETQDERLILTNILRGLLYSVSMLAFGMYIGLKNIILLTDFILVLPCVTLVFMNILAYLRTSMIKSMR